MDAALTKSERETLKAIWRITSQLPGDVASEPAGARTGDLASSLNVTPGAMTATVKKLADRQLVVHTPYHGVCLTDEGRRVAIAVVRRHRIVERFLADFLGYTWAEADRLAVAFEHSLPREVEDRLFLALDRPATCPHGFAIPGSGTDDLPTMPPLYDLGPGDRAVVALPGSTDPEVAEFLEDLGVRPGVELRILDKQPFGGPMIVSVGGQERMLGENLARLILVHRVQEQLTGATSLPQGSVTAQSSAGEASFIQQSDTKRKDPSGDATRR
ncbi:MAG: DtxR family transcriptional regulator [Acidimicrobiales bacterium]